MCLWEALGADIVGIACLIVCWLFWASIASYFGNFNAGPQFLFDSKIVFFSFYVILKPKRPY